MQWRQYLHPVLAFGALVYSTASHAQDIPATVIHNVGAGSLPPRLEAIAKSLSTTVNNEPSRAEFLGQIAYNKIIYVSTRIDSAKGAMLFRDGEVSPADVKSQLTGDPQLVVLAACNASQYNWVDAFHAQAIIMSSGDGCGPAADIFYSNMIAAWTAGYTVQQAIEYAATAAPADDEMKNLDAAGQEALNNFTARLLVIGDQNLLYLTPAAESPPVVGGATPTSPGRATYIPKPVETGRRQVKSPPAPPVVVLRDPPRVSPLPPVAGHAAHPPPPVPSSHTPRPEPAGGYGPSQPSGGYGPSQPSGEYRPSQPSGGYGPSQPSGGYGPSQPPGGGGTVVPDPTAQIPNTVTTVADGNGNIATTTVDNLGNVQEILTDKNGILLASKTTSKAVDPQTGATTTTTIVKDNTSGFTATTTTVENWTGVTSTSTKLVNNTTGATTNFAGNPGVHDIFPNLPPIFRSAAPSRMPYRHRSRCHRA